MGWISMATRDELVAALDGTRCRPYRRNDQAWVEQKNGAVARRAVGYRRYEGLDTAAALARLYASLRLFVRHAPLGRGRTAKGKNSPRDCRRRGKA
jgi:hypothetical protein